MIVVRVRKQNDIDWRQFCHGKGRGDVSLRSDRAEPYGNAAPIKKHGVCQDMDAVEVNQDGTVAEPEPLLVLLSDHTPGVGFEGAGATSRRVSASSRRPNRAARLSDHASHAPDAATNPAPAAVPLINFRLQITPLHSLLHDNARVKSGFPLGKSADFPQFKLRRHPFDVGAVLVKYGAYGKNQEKSFLSAPKTQCRLV